MRIFSFFDHLTLTNDQQIALESLQNFLANDERVFILQGYAGSGKTMLLKGLVEYLQSIEKQFQLMAPTGRAAKVINQKTGFLSTTIHKGIYSFKDLLEIEEGEEENEVSFLYQYKIGNNPKVHDSVLIVDEASMVSDILSVGEFFRFGSGHLLKDLLDYGRITDSNITSKIIFVGDPAQLPPIGMNFSPALDPIYLNENYQINASLVEMKGVKRQNTNNGILIAATKIRKSLTSGYFNDFDLTENGIDIFNPPYSEYLETYKAIQEQKIIICYKNKTALDLNMTIREDRYGKEVPIQASDKIIIGSNNYNLGIVNGEFGVVVEASPEVVTRELSFNKKGGEKKRVRLTWRSVELIFQDSQESTKSVRGYILENYLYGDNYLKPEEQRALYVDFKIRNPNLKKGTKEFKEAITNDLFFNCIQLKYGYAVTCHKAQGGEWPKALIFWDRGVKADFNFYESVQDRTSKANADFYRWAYTAITRPSSVLYAINPPNFNSFTEMTFINNEIQKAFNELTGKQSPAIEINFDAVLPQLEKFGLKNAPLTIQDHFIKRWYLLRKQYIDLVSWEKVGYEIRYTFKREAKSASFKHWVNGKNEFIVKFQKIPIQTNSDELFESISKILDNSQEIVVNRKNIEGILTQIEFDIELEESKPFLKNLFDQITNQLNEGVKITDLNHFDYRDRYTFEKNGKSCIIDFEYKKSGFFGRVLPIGNKCEIPEIIENIRSIVNNLKKAAYVL